MEFLGSVFINLIFEKFLVHEALVTGRVTATSYNPGLWSRIRSRGVGRMFNLRSRNRSRRIF